MKSSIRDKLEQLSRRKEELDAILGDEQATRDMDNYRRLTREHAEIEPVVALYGAWQVAEANIAGAREMLADPEMKEMAQEEIVAGEADLVRLDDELQKALLPKDPNDERNLFLEIRAGTGGDESALFAGDLYRMYTRYAERQGWRLETLDASPGEHGGYKKLVARVEGQGVYARLKFESGAHRVQRVPATEAQGRIHTSACTVAILPEPEEAEQIEINPAELKVDTYRASGAGGQHVNTTESAIRITHVPSGIVVECQEERSQHKNRARAMALLQARLVDDQRAAREAATSASRRLQVGSGDRSERIRTYNYPQGRVTDHRINLTLYALEDVLDGNLDLVILPLQREYQAEQLKGLAEAAA